MTDRATLIALQQRANALMRQGRDVEAIDAYGDLLRADPSLSNSWFNLAWLQRRARRFEDALSSYGQALAQGVSGREEVHTNRAAILAADLGRHEEARRELERALEIRADYLPALLNLGNLHEDLGSREAARECYERALAIAPDHPLALARWAGLREIDDPGDPVVPQLKRVAENAHIAWQDRSDAGFALGRLLDGCGAYREAFAAYQAANEASAAAFEGQARPYDARAAEREIDDLISAYPGPINAAAVDETDRPAPIFICGMFRSGSTLAERLLAQHPLVTAGGELDILPALIARHWPDYPRRAAGQSTDALESLRAAYLAELDLRFDTNALVTDKRPDNFLLVGLIKTLFPAAKIVDTRRNPCDTALSIYFHSLGLEYPYAVSLQDTAHWIGQYRRLSDHWRNVFPDSVHSLDYDRLVADPASEVHSLLEFLGLPMDERCLSPMAENGAVRTGSVWQVRQPLHDRSSGRWRHYADEMRAVSAQLDCD